MARRQPRGHNVRRGDSGASWISYSDLMASLILIFVLVLSLSLYQYMVMMQTKTQELEDQKIALVTKQTELDEANATLLTRESELAENQSALDKANATLATREEELATNQAALNSANAALLTRENELAANQSALDKANATLVIREEQLAANQAALDHANATLALRENELEEQKKAFDAQTQAFTQQTQHLDAMLGIKTQIIKDLSNALSEAQLRATVDKETGDIVLDSSVLFRTNRYSIEPAGQAFLDSFVPVYLSVLMRPEYSDYLGEIIIEGHTDTDGEYISNLKLSQNRALTVAEYCLNMPSLSVEQRSRLRSILTATGKSFSQPIYRADGTVDKDASRRVEFKFSMKDREMIDEINRILNGNGM